MQSKLTQLAKISAKTGLRISKSKTKVMRVNIRKADKLELDGEAIDEVENFTYLGSNIGKDGGSVRDIQVRIGKARTAFAILTPVWRSKVISRKTKLRIFNTNVRSVLLYGSETWRVTKATFNKLQSFVNRCLRSIMGIHWPEVIRNEELKANQQCHEARTEVEPIGEEEPRPSQEQLEENRGRRGGQGRLHLQAD